MRSGFGENVRLETDKFYRGTTRSPVCATELSDRANASTRNTVKIMESKQRLPRTLLAAIPLQQIVEIRQQFTERLR